MDLGHGFIPRVDARNYKAVERCLTRDGPGLFHEVLDVPWAGLEGPWALQHGAATLELCRNRGVSVLVDTQAWRYRDARTFVVDKFHRTALRAHLADQPVRSSRDAVVRRRRP